MSFRAARSLLLPSLLLLATLGCHGASPATTPPIASQLIGFTWILRRVNGQPAGMGSNGRQVTLRFGADGNASGFGGCNRYRATYTIESDSLRFRQPASTDMACSEGMSLERNYLQTLIRVRAWRLTDRHLELLGDGETLADFDRP